ncbi:MAG: xanthine dehydrogenase family protein molybdopterin-binding subunit, partial [candidate division NC10 bacterium]
MIGASPLRKEDRRLLTGSGRYLDDITRDGTLHLGVVRSIQPHARVVKVHARDALALPGVVAVWSAADLPEIAKPLQSGGIASGRPFAQAVLVKDIARYVGEPVAAVLADDPYRLADALEAVTVEYEPLPPLATADAAQRSSARLHPGWPDNGALVVRGSVGNAEQALAKADVV